MMLALTAAFLLASCSRSGANTAPLSYVAFGDSFAAWETLHGFGYTKSLKDALASERKRIVKEQNFARAGDYSADVLAALRQPEALEAIRAADVVSWNAGTNDFSNARFEYRTGLCGGADNQDCLRSAVATFKANWDAIVETLRTAPHKPGATFVTITLFYPEGADGDPAYAATSPYLDAMNAHVRSSTSLARVIDVQALFNGPDGREAPQAPRPGAPDGLVQDDGHPNAAGVALIAESMRALAGQTSD